ncbi:Calx-beta domain-containing protein [Psychrobacter sanguinis]|uniref:Calx-beta domain-containing protein n=3 Tax=Psychrobacter sanguinis TaxID=861445 RepID=UPI00363A4661
MTVTVEYTGTAINGDDYTTVSTTVTIPAGASSVNLNIETLTDLLDEGLENVVITVTGATGGGFEALGVDADKCVADVDITDIPHSRVEVNDVIVDEDAGYAEFTVTLTGGIPTADVSVDYATGDVTALNGPDYTGITGTLTFAAGTTVFTQTVQVPIIDDVYAEPYETYDMTLSNSVNATISHSGIGTITDEEQLPDLVEVSIVDNYDAVNEGDTATFPIELRDEAGNLVIAATNVTVTVEYTGTAINGDDYTSVSTTVTILAGESSVNLDIETLTDLLDEDLENVVITVTDATGGGFEALGDDADKCVADVDIIDSSYTTIEIDDVTVDEDAGNAVFTVTLTGDAPTADVTVDYATGDVTALDASDYTGVTGTLVFPLGTLTQTITVPILDDNIAEVAETYSVTLSNAVNATILNSGVGTITDECHTDLDSVYVSIVDNVDSVYEGEVATFTVELRDADGNLNAAITDVTVDIHYSGVAIDGTDYIGVTSVTIPANSSSVDFDITTLDDYIAEGSEIVNIELNSVTGGGFEAIAVDPTKATADMNIVDDCCEAESVVVSILDFVTNVVEGGNGVFPIELHDQDGNPVSAITDTTVDIHYSGVGIDGTDFTGISTIVIPAGSQSNYLVLETIDDNFAEGSELVNIELFNVSGGGFEAIAVDPDHNTADMNIVDDCDSVFVSILDFTTDVIEASSGLFPIVLKDADGNAINAVTDITVNIEYSGVAIDGTDFTGIASVVIPAGAQSTNLILQTLDDNIAEGSEIVNIELTSVSGGGFEAIALDPVMYVADMNIVDDCNYPVTVSIFDNVDSIYEGELASFPIYLTNVDGDPQVALTDVTVTIEYTGSATNGDDYTGSFTVVIPAGASSVDLDIASLEDLLAEGDEIVDITISNPVGGGFEVIGVNPMADTANVTIKDSTIQITVEPSAAFEGDDLVHMVTLSNPSMTDETYSFSLTEGTATENVDYSTAVSFSDGVTFNAVTGEITVPAGVTSFTVTYPTIDDSYADDGETTTLTIGGSSATGTINDEPIPDPVEVSIVDNVDSIYEGTVDPDNIGSFPIELRDQNGDLITAATDVTVDVTYSGTADNGDDFTGVIQVTIPAGQSSVNLDLTVIDDLLAEDDEIVDITISNPVGGGFEAIGIDPDANTADMTIISNDYIQITVEPTAAFEGDDLVHMVTLSNPSMTDETYSFSLTEGTATENVDYSTAVSFSDGVTFDAVTGEITVPAGVTSFTVTYPTIDDSYADDGETTTLSIGGSSATGTINDEPIPDPVEVSIVDDYLGGDTGDINEGEMAIFPIELRDANGDLIVAATDVTVTVEYTGMAANGVDYTTVSTTVVILAGTSSVDLNIETLTDALNEDLEDVVITITEVTGGGFEAIAIDTDNDVADVTIIDAPYYSVEIDDVTVDEDAGFAEFTVTLAGDVPPTADVTVDYATGDVTAVDGSDYTGVTGTITFTAGTTVFTQTIQVPIIDDAYAELPETYDVILSNAVNATILNNGVGTIIDEPTPDTVSVSIVDNVGVIDESATSPDNVGSFEIEIRDQNGDLITAATDVTVDVTYSGTADNGDDFTGVIQVTIPAGQSSVNLDLTVIDDLLAEDDEIVDITISNPVGGGFEAIGIDPDANTADMTIISNDYIQIIVEPTAAFEGDDLVHMVTLSNPSMTDETYSFSLTEGTATENVDYSTAVSFSDGVTFDAVTGEITVPAGVTSFTVTYPTIDDSYADDGETTTLTIGGSSATGTINDEYPPDLVEVSIVDNIDSIYEGAVDPDNIGSFPIELRDQNGDLITAATDVTVDVTYSGTADNGDDFTGVIQVTIPAGQSSVNLDLTVIDDLLAEDDEIVDITISNPVGGGFEAIGIDPDANTADMTIISDDYIQITVEPSAAFEGDDLVHMVTLSNPSMTDETYSFSLTEGTATENVDYSTAVSFSDGVTFDAVTGEITVPAGVTSFTVTYPTIDDSYADDGETTTLSIGGSSATGTINDEYPPDLVEVSIVDNIDSIYEGAVDPDNIGSFPIELRDQNGDLITAATDVTVDVTYSGTADNGDDFTGVIQVTIPAGQSSVNLDLTVIDDLLAEDDEIVDITISNPVGGGFESIGVDSDANTADMTIINDDYITDISIDSQSVNEEDGTMTFTVTLSGPAAVADVTVDYATADVTAVDGTDYTNTMGTLTFTPGTLTQTITVPIIDDAVWEATETFDITLSNPSTNANILNSGIGTIVDNDLLAVDDSAAAIEAGGINNGSGSQDATGNVLTNDNPDQTDAIVTDIRVGGVEGSGTAGTLGTALVGTYGTLTVNADGTYVYEVNDDDATVQALNDGDSLTESFNYTMTDGTGSDIAVLEIVIKGSNDCAIPTVTSVTVSEEGLTEFDPIPDTTGNNDTTDSAVATGSISFTDVDNFDANDFSIDLAGPTDITVKGETVSWTWDDLTSQLTGQVVIEGESLEVMTVDVGSITTDGSGGFMADYSTTLLHAIDHSSNDDEDQLDVQFEASVSDGTQSASTNFAVTVEDDRPAQSESDVDIAAATSDSNITIILDTSGSMSVEVASGGGETRLDLAKAAIVKLLDGYDVAGDVKVQLITFAKEAQAQPQWMTIDELKDLLPDINARGGTNYDAALDVAMTSYDNAGGIFGANNYSYFLTDGEPTFGQGTVSDFGSGLNGTGGQNNGNPDNGIQAQEETLWTTFLNANDIKSYAFAFGPSANNNNLDAELDPIAYDGQIGEQGAADLARSITDLNQLDDILIDTLPDVIDYGLVNGNLFGADEGHVLTFTLDGITYDYDGSDGSMVASSPSSDIYSYDQSTTTVMINTQAQGIMTLDFETGKYTYETQSLVVDYQEDITFTLIDDDGDSVQSTQTIFVYSLSAKDDSVITNDTTGILELDQAVLVGNDNTSPNSEVTTTFDVNGGQTSGVDPVIYTTTDFSGVNSFDYTISENDVSSSALVSIEYQQGDTGTVQGTNASETLVGREGLDDTLLGMDGNDILQGKSGDDVLTGGLGEDTFIWTNNDIDGVSTPDLDIITDFEAGDKLNLSDLLQGETIGNAANLADYLNWDAVTEVLSVSADGNFSGGYNAAQSDLNIQIDNYAGDFNNLVDNHII